jgi:hypothetical protein
VESDEGICIPVGASMPVLSSVPLLGIVGPGPWLLPLSVVAVCRVKTPVFCGGIAEGNRSKIVRLKVSEFGRCKKM